MKIQTLLNVLGSVVLLLTLSLLGSSDGAAQLAFLPFIAGAAKAIVGGAVGRVVGRAGSWVGRQVGGAARNPVATGVAVAGAGMIIPSLAPGGLPPMPQGGPYTGPLNPSTLGRIGERLIPGGATGREFVPVNDMTDANGNPVVIYPAERGQLWVPRGYVIVTARDGTKYGMLKRVAQAQGLWSAPPKPPISGYDARAIRRAAAATKRVKKLASKVGFTCTTKGRRSCSTSKRAKR